MKEYIKLFNDLQSADGYLIEDIPFTTTVKRDAESLTPQNVRCNQENKKIVVDGQGNINIVDASPVVPNDEIWYTTTDGEPIELSSEEWPEYTILPYEGGKGVIKFTEDLTEIPSNGFENIENLETIVIPNSVTSIKKQAFYECSSLTYVSMGNGVTIIGEWAFYNCEKLPSIEIPDSVTSIITNAFAYCTGLDDISYTGTMSMWYGVNIEVDVWEKVPATVVHCTDGDVAI